MQLIYPMLLYSQALLRSFAGILSGLLLAGCGTDDSLLSSAPATSPGARMGSNFCQQAGVTADIAGNSGHSLYIPYDDLLRGQSRTYLLEGGDHRHQVDLFVGDFEKLLSNRTLMVLSSPAAGHTHSIRISCGIPDDPTG